MSNVSRPSSPARMVRAPLFAAAAIAAFAGSAAAQGPPPTIRWLDGRGRDGPGLVAGDTLRVQVDGLVARGAYDLVLRDPTGAVLGFARAAADLEGTLGPEVLWWQSGVTGVDPGGKGLDGDGFATFAEAERFLAAVPLVVELRDSDPRDPANGPLVASQGVPVVTPRPAPILWFSDDRRNYRNSFEAGLQAIHVSGERLPAGAVVDLFVVGDREIWESGAELVDVTGFRGSSHRKRVHLAPGSTSFTLPVWPAVWQRSGRFDLVARVVEPGASADARFRDDDLLFHGVETGLEVRPPPPPLLPAGSTDLEAQLAGRRTFQSLPPTFRFQDVFMRHSSVRAALDPTDVPPHHRGGRFASIHVVRSRTEAQWHTEPRIGLDLTETVEVRRMKPGTLEFSIGLIWTDPDPALANHKQCDVVLDFVTDFLPGFSSGTTSAPPSWGGGALFNGVYDIGVDVIDRLDGVGLRIVDDPAEPGPYPVGRTDYDFVDAYDIPWGQYRDQDVDVRAVAAYPGQSAGLNVPVYGTSEIFPLVVILHGNHQVCTNFQCTCNKNQRVPNHKGYDYLLDLWASHGFIAVSIDGYDITGCPADRFIERGALMLEHLRYWLNWNDPSVPDATFGGRYYDRVDVDRIGIAGHSRGGEGAAAAVQINQDLALGYAIKALITIAPTDFNSGVPPGGGPTQFVVAGTPLFNIMGSSDGDVIDMQGAQLWDRAAPDGRRATKAQAFVYGADHNSWNTIWIDPAWGGFSDGVGGNRISAQQQQDTGRVYMTAWWMAFLQGRAELLALHRGVIDSPRLDGVTTHWSYEATDHLDIDHFQDTPADKNFNSLGGANVASPPPLTWQENGLRPGNYDGSFYQDTNGLIVGWSALTDYVVDVPPAFEDVTSWSYLAVRAAQIWDGKVLNPGGAQHFLANLEDANGVRAIVNANSRGFAPIPAGYYHPRTGTKSMLSSIRIPLRAFTQNDSGVDLTRIRKVIITFENTGLLAIDDVQFSK